MTITAPVDYLAAQIRGSSHEPWIRNGEQELAQLLKRKDIGYEYESRFYAFVYQAPGKEQPTWGGFCPDFYLPATAYRPAVNVELTFADHGLPDMPRDQYHANQARLETKKLKIAHTSELYGIETVLVTYAVFLDIRREHRHLDRLIRNAASRHYYAARQRIAPRRLAVA
jgi:hypothetical protein